MARNQAYREDRGDGNAPSTANFFLVPCSDGFPELVDEARTTSQFDDMARRSQQQLSSSVLVMQKLTGKAISNLYSLGEEQKEKDTQNGDGHGSNAARTATTAVIHAGQPPNPTADLGIADSHDK
ncbi:MAG: hypothetical protein M1818_004353 [Claussenomyces sp. TS43310]|nr:MAG: hypothetical protein M1818_004353 [Claussenomyces sp. TS43310]